MKNLNNLKLYDEFKINEDSEYDDIIESSYINFMNSKNKEVMADQISMTAMVYIQNKGSKLQDWLNKFKDEPIVINKLKEI
jgi:hypothetical protein